MEHGIDIIEVGAAAGDGLPGDYCLARELALAGSIDEAKRIYTRLLSETSSSTLQAIIDNDLAALALAAGDMQTGRELLRQALEFDARCDAALENWSAFGFDQPPFATTIEPADLDDGVGCQVSGVRKAGGQAKARAGSEEQGAESHREEGVRCQVSGVRCQESRGTDTSQSEEPGARA
jgi:hypothetical protein